MALDDFGSGYNALAQLHSLPVDIVKLDSTLTDVDVAPERAGALCRSVLAICAELDIVGGRRGHRDPGRGRGRWPSWAAPWARATCSASPARSTT